MLDNLPPLGLQRVKVMALAVADLNCANPFYGRQLGLPPAFEGEEQVGWWLDSVILMLEPNWAAPTSRPNPRVTLATEHAPAPQDALRARGIVITDEVRPYGDFYVGSFLDSEGNKLWFCSPVAANCSRSQSSSRLLAIIGLFVLRLFDSIGVAALTLPATGLAIIATRAHLSVLLLTLSATEWARKRWFS